MKIYSQLSIKSNPLVFLRYTLNTFDEIIGMYSYITNKHDNHLFITRFGAF